MLSRHFQSEPSNIDILARNSRFYNVVREREKEREELTNLSAAKIDCRNDQVTLYVILLAID